MIYAIGDVHGYSDELKRAHDRIAEDKARHGGEGAEVVHLGDLTDRGPDSKGVIDFLLAGIESGEPWKVIKGNHDRFFANFIRTGAVTDNRLRQGMHWLHERMGGQDTIASYGVTKKLLEGVSAYRKRAIEAVPEAHVAFLEGLPLYVETEELLFVHAGIVPGVPLDRQFEDDLLWIRDGFLEDDLEHPWLIVHGHTAIDDPGHFGNRVNLDAGAGYGRPLAAAVFEGRSCFLLTDEGRVRLEPEID